MENFIKLMNNKIVAFVFGMLTALIGYFGICGESNALLFAGTFSLLCVIAKEIINNQMCSNKFNYQIPLFGILGTIVTILGLLLI